MEKFQFYLNPVHFFILFFDLKWGLSEVNQKFKNIFQKKNQFFLQICPTIDPFRDFGAKKKFKSIFLKKMIST